MHIRDAISILNRIAPPALQESYDNAGLITGNPNAELTGILVTLDSTEAIIDEAIAKECNMVVAHHPIVFSGLKSITGKNYIERVIIKAIKNDIAIFAIHTNLDNVAHGVNKMICDRLELSKVKTLAPKKGLLKKIITFVPLVNKAEVLDALGRAGAGNIGNYEKCSFQVDGKGTFEPNEQASPYIGESGKFEEVDEVRIEMVFPDYLERKIIAALDKAHPYEEVAYFIQKVENESPEIGSGMVGELEVSLSEEEFLTYLKEKMELKVIRHTAFLNKPIQKIAVCGGSGSFLLGKAMAQGADIFITADYKYHQFFDADNKIIIADIGHYESEKFTSELLGGMLKIGIGNEVPIGLTSIDTNPVQYFS
ncbi:Nif3-like dinuclear metal center hexameric protein [Flammeovirgaceae bacterium SG7u.111]|nr:Nif3-like dinuclear metal center hexameric protein [Flammeovirgaceae bacterium SG7u.132]WPO33727.1 Nif3-like dinuclear metal center hexameric protein [Flammeovirgaceae bacterium SG7u.111]